MPITVRSFAKINLGLLIGPPRPDGFHALATLYQTLSAHDRVTVALREEPGITLTCNDGRVPTDARNTVWKMLERALAPTDRTGLGVAVGIEKRLPVQGGLGAGSANAVAALIGLERLLAEAGVAVPLRPEERLRIAAEVGSDVPLFLLGGVVLGLERGESVIPAPDLGCWEAVVALPETGVSTPAAFRDWDALIAARGLTPEANAGRLEEFGRVLAAAWCEPHASGVVTPRSDGLAGTLLSTLVQTGKLHNDFEEVVFRQHSHLLRIKRALAGGSVTDGCVYAALSGSGSALFGLYADGRAAEEAVARLDGLGVRSLRTQTQSRAEYWAGMVADREQAGRENKRRAESGESQ